MSGDRSQFKKQNKLIYGLHPEGILEIKIHDPKKKNAFFLKTMIKFTELFTEANNDDKVKCIVVHGGQTFSAGNDVEAFQIGYEDYEGLKIFVKSAIQNGLIKFVNSLAKLEKPLIALVRGQAVGIGFTMLSMADFVYCSPESKFFTPFM